MNHVPASAVQALIKATWRSTHFSSLSDKVAFACHAVATANGLTTLAVGEHTDEVHEPRAPDESVDLAGWNQRAGEYAFLYATEPASDGGAPCTLLLKCLALGGDTLCVTLLASHHPGGAVGAPSTLELPVASTAVPAGASADSSDALSAGKYGDLSSLADVLQAAMRSQLRAAAGGAGGVGGAGRTEQRAHGASTSATGTHKAPAAQGGVQQRGPGSRLQEEHPDRGAGRDAGPGRSAAVGHDHDDGDGDGGDEGWGGRAPGMLPGPMPVRDPLMVGPPRMGGGMMPGMIGPGGGMHVGPGDPLFSGRMRHPMHGPGGVPAPGQRWDPIAPEGLQGWNPEDFQRGANHPGLGQAPPLHPDLAQPGPGRGTDWDHMFG